MSAGIAEMGSRLRGSGGGDAVVDSVHKSPRDGTLMYSDRSRGPPKVLKLYTQTCR